MLPTKTTTSCARLLRIASGTEQSSSGNSSFHADGRSKSKPYGTSEPATAFGDDFMKMDRSQSFPPTKSPHAWSLRVHFTTSPVGVHSCARRPPIILHNPINAEIPLTHDHEPVCKPPLISFPKAQYSAPRLQDWRTAAGHVHCYSRTMTTRMSQS